VSGPALRRLLHAATAGVLLLVPFGSWQLFRVVVLAGAALGVVLEGARLSLPGFRTFLGRHLPVFRERERMRPSGAMWLSVGYAAAALVPAPAPAAGILVAALADPAASLVGTWRRAPGRKTWIGSLAHAATALVVLAALGVTPAATAAAAVVATILERITGRVDDNLLVAPATALTVWLVG
jgi:dolichol kinase